MPFGNKMSGRKSWALIIFIGFALLAAMILAPSSTSALRDEEFKEQLRQKMPAMNLRILSEHSCWLALSDLPLLTRLSMLHFTSNPGADLLSSRDGTDVFLVKDNQTKSQFEIAVHYADHVIRAVTLHYQDRDETGAKTVKRKFEKDFSGLRIVLRKGVFLASPTTAGSTTASNN